MDFVILHKWFHENHKVLNPVKCHYAVIVDNEPSHKMILNSSEISCSNEEKVLGILLDSNLNFDSHILSLCKKAVLKLSLHGNLYFLFPNVLQRWFSQKNSTGV